MPLLELLLDLPEPHPELVSAMRPTPRQVTEAMLLFGLLPEDNDRLFRPAPVG